VAGEPLSKNGVEEHAEEPASVPRLRSG